MTLRLPANSAVDVPYEDGEKDRDCSDSGSDSDGAEDNKELEGWDDWVEEERPCKSLFDDKVLDSATSAVKYDGETHGFDVLDVCAKFNLDFHQRTRLINYIRRENITPDVLSTMSGQEEFLEDDTNLKPTIEDDPLLQLQSNDWSDSEGDADELNTGASSGKNTRGGQKSSNQLANQLAQARKDLLELQNLVKGRLDLIEDAPEPFKSLGTSKRDDDSHYFESYEYNDIHQTMIQDKVRTSSYARFIASNPLIFKDAVVMDVGCGTGILSLFAAQAGAKKVLAIEASSVAKKAQQIVEDNGFGHIITVIRSKVEDLTTLPDGIQHVDIIISEWMGYCCIYESMLDSVLVARDRFLRKPASSGPLTSSPKLGITAIQDEVPRLQPSSPVIGLVDIERSGQGLMAPSQCRMMIGLVDASELIKERVKFWNDVYGFKMTAMAQEIYDEAILDIIGPETLLSKSSTIKDIPLQHITVRALDFSSPFSLTTTRSGELNSFLVYFDTFFTTNGQDVSPEAEVETHKDEFMLGEVIRVGMDRKESESFPRRQSVDHTALQSSPGPGLDANAPLAPPPPPARSDSVNVPSSPMKRPSIGTRRTSRRNSTGFGLPKPVSFSTGPLSTPTHWKQTVFLLRNPVKVRKGTTVSGTFHCRKSETNSRELDVEIHYLVTEAGGETPKESIVQLFKVR